MSSVNPSELLNLRMVLGTLKLAGVSVVQKGPFNSCNWPSHLPQHCLGIVYNNFKINTLIEKLYIKE